jgi:hypothetical protein
MDIFICLWFINYTSKCQDGTDNALEWVWLESVGAYFEVLAQHVPGGTWENHEISWLG